MALPRNHATESLSLPLHWSGAGEPQPGLHPLPSLSVIVPTRNEAGNVGPLLERIRAATTGLTLEVIFVDDSDDDTPAIIAALAAASDTPVRLIARPPERRNGLGKAVIEGMQAATHDWLCVLDGDLQHPPEVIPQLLERAFAGNLSLVAASRLGAGGSAGGLSFHRKIISYVLALLSRLLFPRSLRRVTDPLTGFFLVKRGALDLGGLRPEGFKILLEILVRTPTLAVGELPFDFAERHAGESKANPHEAQLLFRQMLRLLWGAQQSFLRFSAVGAVGFVLNTLLLALFTELGHLHYLLSAILATQGSSLANFMGTELWVFSDRPRSRAHLGVRFLSYLALNNAALLVRSPLLVLLVAMNVNYLLANALTLALIMVLRFALADRIIWRRSTFPVPALPVERA